MFTGLVSAIGEVRAISQDAGVRRLRIEAPYPAADIALGASIAHAGVCLTVLDIEASGAGGAAWSVDLAPETQQRTTLGAALIGDRLNLERSLRAADELGGHLVSGHIDGMGEVTALHDEGGGAFRLRLRPPVELMRFIAFKGSIAVDGVSLTIAALQDAHFDIAIIPHTWSATTLSALAPGRRVNLEVDVIARYVDRWMQERTLRGAHG